MADYIDRDAAIAACFDGFADCRDDCAANIRSIPAADVVEDQKKKIEELTLRNQIQMQEETRLRREIESLKLMVDQLHERERVLLDT